MKTTSPAIAGSNSALELYSTAYDFHYNKDDIKEACRLYREIIRTFPDSNESAYAVVQLEKIGAQEALKSLQGGSWQKILPIAALLFSLLSFIIAGTALLLVLEKNRNSLYNMEKSSFVCWNDFPAQQSTIINP